MSCLFFNMKKIAVIYMGGTFGCIGEPLQPMPAADFLICLQSLELQQADTIHFFAAPSIKDSTELNAADWLLLAQYIQNLSAEFTHFLIIHGTDTLSYASAFLHHLFKTQLRIILTGSQQPLLNKEGNQLLENSDAWANLNHALNNTLNCPKGVYLAFNHQLHPANESYKQHTESFNAFLSNEESITQNYLKHEIQISDAFIEKSHSIRFLNLYITPSHADQLTIELHHLLKDPPHILVLQGFGSGNLPYSLELERILKELINKGVWVIISTQVLFGTLAQKYATGSWLNNINLVFDPHFSQADLYARATLLYLQYGHQKNWQQYWA